jgi:hypothetical protein
VCCWAEPLEGDAKPLDTEGKGDVVPSWAESLVQEEDSEPESVCKEPYAESDSPAW